MGFARRSTTRTLVLQVMLLVGVAVAVAAGQDVDARRDAGRRALAEGRRDDACGHLLAALELEPTSAETLALLLEANADDGPARALWTLAAYEALADGSGRVRAGVLGGEARRLLAEGPWADLVAARAAAVQELVEFARRRGDAARKRPEEALVADWARRVAADLARPLPALESALAADLELGLAPGPRPWSAVVDGLEGLIRSAAASDPGLAARAARVLHGLAVQAGFEDLRGEAPRSMERVRADAARALARARATLAERAEPWTVAELEWLTTEEGEAFTRAHDDFGAPGTALSPNELYRVETDCGFETLLGTARTVELHHRRLANWYGEDPFQGRQGTVRVVPTHAGLEAEGAPFWWAGGFQGGDTTVVRHAMGNIEGLGRVITHELTHRFDGALFPGQPAWLTEGKAVWTGAAYGHSSDETFVENHAAFGTLASVGAQGWGSAAKLDTLVSGTVEDYRDNYSAGYSLYVYLNTWEDPEGTPLFRARLRSFMENAREGGRDPRRFFESKFCDGADGRPATFAEFAAGFASFLDGFRAPDPPGPPDWRARYTQAVPRGPADPTTLDEPTWPWSHARHEPPFGREQARLAGEVLVAAGEERDAVEPLIWALAVDGREPRTWRALHEALVATRRADAAWVAAHALSFPALPSAGPEPDPELGPELGPAPFLRDLGATRAFLAALAEAAAASAPLPAAALAADHDALARWLGAPELGRRLDEGPSPRHPLVRPPRTLGRDGWVEAELVGHEPANPPGPWAVDGRGALHLGRRAPRTSTGFEAAGGGAVYVRDARRELPGAWVLRARIQPTTVRSAGSVVVGGFDRDRALRFAFTADASRGAGEPSLEAIGWSLSGTWERDGPLEGSSPSGRVDFKRSVSGFALELVVDGPSVRAFVDGRFVGAYANADGAPIEGAVGFATSSGAIEVRDARVQRLERARLAGLHGAGTVSEPGELDLARARAPGFERLENLRVVGVPRFSQGTLMLWIPMPWPEPGRALDPDEERRRAVAVAERLARAHARANATQPVVVVLPAALGEDVCASFERALEPLFRAPPTFLRHAFDGAAPPGLPDAPDGNKRWLVLLDPVGLARVAIPASVLGPAFSGRLARWLAVLRDHGRPPRELPPLERGEKDR